MPISWKPNKYLDAGFYEMLVAHGESVEKDGYYYQLVVCQVQGGNSHGMEKELKIFSASEYDALCGACRVPANSEPNVLIGRRFHVELFKTQPNKQGKTYINARNYRSVEVQKPAARTAAAPAASGNKWGRKPAAAAPVQSEQASRDEYSQRAAAQKETAPVGNPIEPGGDDSAVPF